MTKASAKSQSENSEVMISEQDGIRSLHLGGSMVQSAMRISAPNELELVYTQYMMSFLLFHPDPKKILMVGLGGGSLAKFVYHYLPETKLTIVENNQQVVTASYQYFELPDENARFEIVLADGAQYVATHPQAADIIMIDGFDNDYQVPALSSQEFYDHAQQAVNRNGMLVVNLLSRDKRLKQYLQCIENSFNGHLIAVMTEKHGNLIVFAFRNYPGKHSWKSIRKNAQRLEKQYPLPFLEFAEKL